MGRNTSVGCVRRMRRGLKLVWEAVRVGERKMNMGCRNGLLEA